MKHIIYIVILSTLFACNGGGGGSSKGPSLKVVNEGTAVQNPFSSVPGSVNLYGTSVSVSEFLSKVVKETPCFNGNQVRENVQTELTEEELAVVPNAIYIGVTSYGDVGAIVKGDSGPAIIIGSMCKRSESVKDAVITSIVLGTTSNCVVRPIDNVQVEFKDGSRATFRALDHGNTDNDPYTFCKPASYVSTEYCSIYPWMLGCTLNSTSGSGTTSGSTTSGGTTTGETTGETTGSSTGSTTGSSTGETTGGVPEEPVYVNPYPALPSDNSWISLYSQGLPAENCSTPTGTGYDVRMGTITASGGTMYAPNNPWSSLGDSEYTSISYSHNTSTHLTSVMAAKDFFQTDAVLKIRFKVRPQPKAPNGKTWCLGRVTGQSTDPWGYNNLKYAVSLRPLNADGTVGGSFIGTRYFTTKVNSCSVAADFSGYIQNAPYGVVVFI